VGDDLYSRGSETLLTSWEEVARGSAGAALHRLSGVAAAVFPSEPERSIYNNALLERDLGPSERSSAVEAMRAAYAAAGIESYAAWVHETDDAMQAELLSRGYAHDETTRAMGMSLQDGALAPPDIDLGPATWSEYLEFLEDLGVPHGLLRGTDPAAFHVLAARLDGKKVAAVGLTYDHDRDCGVFNVTTIEAARRRGLGAALTVHLLNDALGRGCSTASLQSTAMAENVYAAIGFRDLGRIFEYVPTAHSQVAGT
jgi:ribosomal protein S18 acetylase RimI-like enzyme